MNKAQELILSLIATDEFLECNFSSPRSKSGHAQSLHIKKTSKKNILKIEHRFKKHNDIKDLTKEDFIENLSSYLSEYKQSLIRSQKQEHQILINKKLQSHIKSKTYTPPSKAQRNKNYIIPDGIPCDFLIEIGVMDVRGKVKAKEYKKFKQINHFIELIDHSFKAYNKESIRIVDFGCGKSYLTFAINHYFTRHKKINAHITGLDLKSDVVDDCNRIAKKIKAKNITFKNGLIENFSTDQKIDFVVSLHACDTATDDAILFALEKDVSYMMMVPCCQHELNSQLQNSSSQIMLQHGVMKDKFTALVTDSMRAQLLKCCNYKTQVIEFIDTAHTPKNIMLKATKNSKEQNNAKEIEDYLKFKAQWNIEPYLEKQLLRKNKITFS